MEFGAGVELGTSLSHSSRRDYISPTWTRSKPYLVSLDATVCILKHVSPAETNILDIPSMLGLGLFYMSFTSMLFVCIGCRTCMFISYFYRMNEVVTQQT